MPHRVLSDRVDVDLFTRFLAGLKLPVTVSWVQGRDRSSEQNRLQWQWAKDVAEQRGESPRDIQHEWKLRLGVPILRADSEEFREVYDATLKPLPYALKLKAMAFVSVTSDMTVGQMSRFLDEVQRECLSQGLWLTDPTRLDERMMKA